MDFKKDYQKTAVIITDCNKDSFEFKINDAIREKKEDKKDLRGIEFDTCFVAPNLLYYNALLIFE
jgi:hypothetical protein